MEKERKLYRYEGAVTQFGKVIQDLWKAGTQADSESRAKANLMFQYKVKHKMDRSAKIELPGNVYIPE